MRLIAFCEANADFTIARDLVDRVLREHGPPWAADLMDADKDSLREWLPDPKGRPFFDLHRIDQYLRSTSVRITHGHFNGAPGAPGALMARNVFSLVRALSRENSVIDGVLLLWDMDGDAASRRMGLHQARREAERWATFGIVVGTPNVMREAWVLVGFEPLDDTEVECLSELRRELGFHPQLDAHLLDASDETAKRSAKRVLRAIVGVNADREERCWLHTPLMELRARGAQTYLTEFLDQIHTNLISRL